MYLTYTFLLYAGLVAAFPYFAVRFRRYLPTLKDRMGFLTIPQLKNSVWVHAVSVGEVRSVQRLLEQLRTSCPGQPVVLSTSTPPGHRLATNTAGLADHVFYFPLDIPGAIRRTLDRVDPELVLIAETEIWPNFVRECARRRIRVVMINGRISDRSFPRYRMAKPWLKRVLKDYTLLGMQSEIDRERIQSVGADSTKVTVFGNLKYDALQAVKPLEPQLSDVLARCQPLWIAASTTDGEEIHILHAFAELRRKFPSLRLLIAPRHPERFDDVAKLVASHGFDVTRRDSMTGMRSGQSVLLLDSIGELASTFQHAAVVFVGGTLVPRGGHNILEPAAFSKPIVFGPHMQNFREIRDQFLEANAAVQVRDTPELVKAVADLLSDAHAAVRMGENARRVVDRNSGATEKVLAYLK